MNEHRGQTAGRKFRALVRIAVIAMVLFVAAVPSRALAFETEEFLTACTYGTITGTLVGGASLAFTKHPGDHFNRIARGASLGLYAGVALGLYVAWLPSDSKAAEVMRDINIVPTVSEKGIDGAQASYAILRF